MARANKKPKLRDKSRVKRRSQAGSGRILSPKSVALVQRRYQVLTLRKQGYTIKEIAETLGIGDNTAREDLVNVLANTIKDMAENTEEARQLEIDRFDDILRTYYPLAKAGNLAATSVVLQVSAQRRRLLALDKPETKILEHTGVREYIGVDLEQV